MPKRKSCLSTRTMKARKSRIARKKESEQERENRLMHQRIRQSILRARENSSERESRLEYRRIRRRISRRNAAAWLRRMAHKKEHAQDSQNTISGSLESDDASEQCDHKLYILSESVKSEDVSDQQLDDDHYQHVLSRNLMSKDSRDQQSVDYQIRHAFVMLSRSEEAEHKLRVQLECESHISQYAIKTEEDDSEVTAQFE